MQSNLPRSQDPKHPATSHICCTEATWAANESLQVGVSYFMSRLSLWGRMALHYEGQHGVAMS